MENTDIILWILLIIGILTLARRYMKKTEPFANNIAGISLASLTTQALDSAPTTSEVKNHYKNLLLFADADIKQQGTKGLRILADFRDRVYGPRNFRDDLKAEDFIANWPTWLPPLDTTIQEPVVDSSTAVTAESQMLAYLQRYFPQEPNVDEQTGATIRNIIEDFGYRFVFKKGLEVAQVGPDFLKQPLLKNWSNPATKA